MKLIDHPDQLPEDPHRIVVVGTTGSGKSTLARAVAECTGCVHIGMDELAWEDDWVRAPEEVICERFDEQASGGRWVFDGNFDPGDLRRERILARADLVLWLDLPMPVVLWRLTLRSIRRAWTREPMWGTNNTESFRMTFLSHDSVILWSMRTHGLRRRQYRALAASDEFDPALMVRLGSGREADRWVEALGRGEDSRSPPRAQRSE